MGGDRPDASRRAVLRASGGVLGFAGIGTASASEGDRANAFRDCPEATVTTGMRHCENAAMDGCADEHPETRALRRAVADALDRRYPTVGALIDRGFVPYFDLFERDGYSHWLNPEYIGDDAVLDPDRPESVLVDNEWWRPIGVMFIATRDGDPIERPPAVYVDDPVGPDENGRNESEANGPDESDESESSIVDDSDPNTAAEDGPTAAAEDDPNGADGADETVRCAPWHYHVGLPSRYAWWKYRIAYHGETESGGLGLPCRTPCMMHVWTVPHPEGVYAHGAPPREHRGGPPAEPAGFDTAADPTVDTLGARALPDGLDPL